MRNVYLGVVLVLLANVCKAQNRNSTDIFRTLKQMDSLLFNIGFNSCDTVQLAQLVSDDFEFYHDQSGMIESKDSFLRSIPSLCQLSYKPSRKLMENSLMVYLLYKEDHLYGALQIGQHEFYAEEVGRSKYLTSTASFSHLWIIENGYWKLKRGISYDHISPKELQK